MGLPEAIGSSCSSETKKTSFEGFCYKVGIFVYKVFKSVLSQRAPLDLPLALALSLSPSFSLYLSRPLSSVKCTVAATALFPSRYFLQCLTPTCPCAAAAGGSSRHAGVASHQMPCLPQRLMPCTALRAHTTQQHKSQRAIDFIPHMCQKPWYDTLRLTQLLNEVAIRIAQHAIWFGGDG